MTTMALAGVLMAAGAAAAADGPLVMGNGSEEVKVLPSAVQLTIKLVVKKESLDEAIAEMETRTKETVAKIRALAPTEDSLVVSGPVQMTMDKEARQRMRYMRGRYEEEEEEEDKKDESMLTTEVKAQWALASTEMIPLLREAAKLRKAVDEAFPKEEKEEKEPETEEEMERMLMAMAEAEEGGPEGRPIFTYVSKLSQDQLDQALRKAFAEAKTRAARTAKAAGAGLGAIVNVNSTIGASASSMRAQAMMYEYGYPSAYRGMAGGGGTDAESPQLGEHEFAVGITVSFKLKGSE